ncbi:glycosyltransferase family 2 protein [Entomomonas asaccharolytica]|uniref:Glycosyltransferase n=1 Tax=Entomomonas asaccharolytica TaxID=2785331 RepID=A0A974RW11_9GAMM|nr:glycosyltransferase [Entomomonas asaccharolytica]QQP84695.1 glycosyltransferase [Entomomonas asaccharolytica]
MKNIFCSIIVPMFNEANNLESCLNALKNQIYKNFEVIFIDDGSTDNTVEKLTKLLKNQINFSYKILQQSNKGAAAAREKGIVIAKGEYICLLDCDDELSSDALDKAIMSICQYNADISMFQLYNQDSAGTYHKFNFFDQGRLLYNGFECLINSLGEWKVHGLVVCKKKIFIKSYQLYKKYNKEDINFLNNDEVITRLNFFNAKVVVRNEGIYYYKFNNNSTSKRINPNRHLLLHNCIIMHDLFKEIDSSIHSNIDRELFKNLSDIIKYYLKNKKEIYNKQEWKKTIKLATTEVFKQGIFWKLTIKTKLKFFRRLFKTLYNK